MAKPTNILIYLTGGLHWIGGIQYTRNLLSAVALLPRSERPRMVVRIGDNNRGQGYEEEFGRLPGVVIDGPVEPTWWERLGHRWLRRPLPSGNWGQRCDLGFPAKGPGIPDPLFKMYWIPDFQYKNLPDFFPAEERQRRDAYYAEMHAEAQLMVLSSRAVARDYRKFFPEAQRIRVEILPFSTVLADSDWAIDSAATVARLKLPPKFVYAPNQIWQHKGHDTVFEAIALLKRAGCEIPVVCTGSAADYRSDAYYSRLMQQVAESGIGGQVHLLGLLPRCEQVQLFRECTCVVQASRFEGWSTVVEDARCVGRPLVVSDLEVHREQDPPLARFFPTGDAADLAAQVRHVWEAAPRVRDPAAETRARLASRERGVGYARRFLEIVDVARTMSESANGTRQSRGK